MSEHMRVLVAVALALSGCDTFPAIAIRSELSDRVQLELSTSVPFSGTRCGEVDDGEDRETFAAATQTTVGLDPGDCWSLGDGISPTADALVGGVERVVVRRGDTPCLDLTGEQLDDRFETTRRWRDGEARARTLFLRTEDCPPR